MQAKFNLLLLRNSKKPLSIRMNFLIYCVRQRKYADNFFMKLQTLSEKHARAYVIVHKFN